MDPYIRASAGEFSCYGTRLKYLLITVSVLSSDPSLNPHLLIPVFTAISGPWEEIQVYEESEDVRATITEIGEEEMTKKPRPHTTVPFWRASRFLEKFSDRDKVRAEAAKYYALYHPDPSWSDLSLALTRAQETEAVERAIEIMTGM